MTKIATFSFIFNLLNDALFIVWTYPFVFSLIKSFLYEALYIVRNPTQTERVKSTQRSFVNDHAALHKHIQQILCFSSKPQKHHFHKVTSKSNQTQIVKYYKTAESRDYIIIINILLLITHNNKSK